MVPALCPDCGTTLPHGVSAWLCPVCALTAGPEAGEGEDEDEKAKSGEASGGPASPVKLGKYQLLEELGRGGMGVVYRARQIGLNRIVALKVLPGAAFSGAALRERFAVEAESAARLRHPHIVAVHEAGEHLGQPYLSMDLIEGESLAGRLAGGPLPYALAAHLVRQIAGAVEHAHQQGVTHRDLKPSNILVTPDNVPYLVDFGLARLREMEGTLSSALLGSPNYMPPERLAGASSAHPVLEDIYGLGGVLYQTLTGRPPIVGETLQALLVAARETDPIPPGRLVPAIPLDLETICLKCLEKAPSARYATAAEVAAELDRFLRGEPILARPLGPAARAWRWARRRPAIAALGAGLVTVLAAGSIISTLGWRSASSHAQAAKDEAEARRIQLYTSDILVAGVALAGGDPGPARRHLQAAVPASHQTDLRGVEWYLLNALLQPRSLVTVQAHSHILTTVSWHPDGHQLLSGSHEGSVKLWWWEAGRLIPRATLRERGKAQVRRLQWLPDGSGYLSATLPLGIELRRPEAAAPLWTVPGAAFSLSADGKSLAVSTGGAFPFDDPGEVTLYRLTDGNSPPTLLRKFPETARAVGISPDGKWLAVGVAAHNPADVERNIQLHDLTKPEAPPVMIPTGSAVWNICFSPDSHLLSAAHFSTNPEVTLYDLAAGSLLAPAGGHTLHAWMTAFTGDSATLLSVASDRAIRATRLADRTVTTLAGAHENEIWCLALHPSENCVATGDKDGTLSLSAYPLPQALPAEWPVDRYSRVVFTPDSGSVIRMERGADGGSTCHRTNLSTGQSEALPDHGTLLGISSGGDRVTLDTVNARLLFWSEHGSVPVRTLALPLPEGSSYSETTQSTMSSDGRYACVLTTAGLAVRADLLSGTVISVPDFLPEEPIGITVSSDGRYLIATSWLTLLCRDFTAGKTIQLPNDPQWGKGLAVSPDGRWLSSGGVSGHIELRSLPGLELHTVLRGHREEASFTRFSPDGKTLISSEIGVGLRFWRMDSLRQALSLPVAEADAIAISPDGQWLAVTRCVAGGPRESARVQLLAMPR